MRKKIIEDMIVGRIAQRRSLSINKARRLYKNCLTYNVVIDAILEQADFLDTQKVIKLLA